MKGVRFWIFILTFLLYLLLLFNAIIRLHLMSPVAHELLTLVLFALKFTTIMAVCHYFIKRAGRLIQKEDQDRLMKMKAAIAWILLAMFVILAIYLIVDLTNKDKAEIQVVSNFVCYSVVPSLFDLAGLLSYLMLAVLAHQVKSAMFKMKLSAFATRFSTDLDKVRKCVITKALVFLYVLICCSLYSFVYNLTIFLIFPEPACVPKRISVELDSFFALLQDFVTYQLWFIPLCLHFWPTKSNLADNYVYSATAIVMLTEGGEDTLPNETAYTGESATLRGSTLSL